MKRGFTLLEVLVVVTIIAIISAIALPRYRRAVNRGRMMESVSNLSHLQKGIDMYRTQFRGGSRTFLGAGTLTRLDVDLTGGLTCDGEGCHSETYNYTASCSGEDCNILIEPRDANAGLPTLAAGRAKSGMTVTWEKTCSGGDPGMCNGLAAQGFIEGEITTGLDTEPEHPETVTDDTTGPRWPSRPGDWATINPDVIIGRHTEPGTEPGTTTNPDVIIERHTDPGMVTVTPNTGTVVSTGTEPSTATNPDVIIGRHTEPGTATVTTNPGTVVSTGTEPGTATNPDVIIERHTEPGTVTNPDVIIGRHTEPVTTTVTPGINLGTVTPTTFTVVSTGTRIPDVIRRRHTDTVLRRQ